MLKFVKIAVKYLFVFTLGFFVSMWLCQITTPDPAKYPTDTATIYYWGYKDAMRDMLGLNPELTTNLKEKNRIEL